MEKQKKVVIILALLIISVVVISSRNGEQTYACNADFTTDAPTYYLGDIVSFTLTNTSDINCTSDEEYPWMILKLAGDVWDPSYSPAYDPTPWVLLPTELKTWSWDQITTEGSPATEGDYLVWVDYTSEYGRRCTAFFTITTAPPATTTPAPTTAPPTTEAPTTTPPGGERFVPPPPTLPGGAPPGAPPSWGIGILGGALLEEISENIDIIVIILVVILICLIHWSVPLIFILGVLVALLYALCDLCNHNIICPIIGFFFFILLYRRKKKKEGR